MKIIHSKSFIGLVSFIFGVGSMFALQRYRAQAQTRSSLLKDPVARVFSDEPLFAPLLGESAPAGYLDPIQEIRRMREGLRNRFAQPEGSFQFGSSFFQNKWNGEKIGEITQREDDHFVYFDVPVEGLEHEKVEVRVKDGQIDISGQVEKRSEEQGAHAYLSSNFHRSFPVPPNVDPDKFRMAHEKDKLVLKFSKIQERTT
jgi:HSP20 family molecular chaperone IbpA